MSLDPDNVPPALIPLLPLAEKWGIGDDLEREELLTRATSAELEELIHSIDDVSDEDLFEWLAGDESYDPTPTPEYLAITNLTLAIGSAKLNVKKADGPL